MTQTMSPRHRNDLIADALKVHETEHCGSAPCADAVRLATLLTTPGIHSIPPGHELTQPRYGNGGGQYVGGNRSTPRDPAASDKQIALIKRLAGERDYLSLGMTQRKLVEDVCNGTVIRKSSASSLIDAMLHTVKADSSSLRPAFLGDAPLASNKQIELILRLAPERGRTYREETLRKMLRTEASELIDGLVALPRVATQTSGDELEAGMYRVGDEIFKVQRAVHGSGRMYAKRLVVDGPGEAHFEIAQGAIRKLTAEDRMTLEDAKAFGALYGVCCNCGATLTDETSIEAGIGPICAKRI